MGINLRVWLLIYLVEKWKVMFINSFIAFDMKTQNWLFVQNSVQHWDASEITIWPHNPSLKLSITFQLYPPLVFNSSANFSDISKPLRCNITCFLSCECLRLRHVLLFTSFTSWVLCSWFSQLDLSAWTATSGGILGFLASCLQVSLVSFL